MRRKSKTFYAGNNSLTAFMYGFIGIGILVAVVFVFVLIVKTGSETMRYENEQGQVVAKLNIDQWNTDGGTSSAISDGAEDTTAVGNGGGTQNGTTPQDGSGITDAEVKETDAEAETNASEGESDAGAETGLSEGETNAGAETGLSESETNAEAETGALEGKTDAETGLSEEESEQPEDETQSDSATVSGTGTLASVADSYNEALGLYAIAGSDVYMETSPEDPENSTSVLLSRNTQLAVMSQQEIDGVLWDEVNYYGTTGWVKHSDLTEVGDTGLLGNVEDVSVYTVPGESVIMYEEPSTSSDELMMLKAGSAVTLLAVQDGWGQVTYDDMTGWILLSNVTSYFENTYYIVNTTTSTRLNLREEPSLDSEVLTMLVKGDVYLVTEIQNGWGRIDTGEYEGWASLYFMTPVSSASGGAAVTLSEDTQEIATESVTEDTTESMTDNVTESTVQEDTENTEQTTDENAEDDSDNIQILAQG